MTTPEHIDPRGHLLVPGQPAQDVTPRQRTCEHDLLEEVW